MARRYQAWWTLIGVVVLLLAVALPVVGPADSDSAAWSDRAAAASSPDVAWGQVHGTAAGDVGVRPATPRVGVPADDHPVEQAGLFWAAGFAAAALTARLVLSHGPTRVEGRLCGRFWRLCAPLRGPPSFQLR